MTGQKVAHCHKKIRTVAQELCGATYDTLMENNEVYSRWKAGNPDCKNGVELRERFIRKNWGRFVEGARTTLGLLLRSAIDDKAKEEIVEILALDQTLRRGRQQPTVLLGSAPTES